MPMTLLVIDLGSSSVRALLFEDGARLIPNAICSRGHNFRTGNDGRADAEATELRTLIEACLDDILTHPAADSIRAIGMASFAGNWLGVDAEGNACTPVYTYADSRARVQIPALKERLGGDAEAYRQATGCILHPAYLPAQYAWLRATDPAREARIHRLCDIGGYLYRHWFAREAPMSYSIASWTGLFDSRAGCWHDEYTERMVGGGLRDKLPRVADFDATQRRLSDDYARRWPALRDMPFYLAVGDGAAANVGSGAVDADHIALTIGTTSALRVVKPVERVPAGLWRYLVQAGMPLVGGATSEGGNVFQWAIDAMRLDAEAVSAALEVRGPDQHGLTVLPLLAGERSPGWHPDASGAIHGLRRNTGGLDILQAQMEAVAMRLSIIFEALNAPGCRVMAGGGALRSSPIWARMIADAFDAPIHLLDEAEITARGVALLLRQRLDGIALDADAPRVSRILRPKGRHVSAFRAARERQLDLYRRLYG